MGKVKYYEVQRRSETSQLHLMSFHLRIAPPNRAFSLSANDRMASGQRMDHASFDLLRLRSRSNEKDAATLEPSFLT